MIIILSKGEFDLRTELVLDWLIFFNKKYKRINGSELINFNQDFSEATAVWFSSWISENKSYGINISESIENTIMMDRNLRDENKVRSEYLFFKLRYKYWLTHPEKISVNKLIVLEEAKQIGLSIPETVLLNNKESLNEFRKQSERIITKSMANPVPLITADYNSFFYTKEVTDEIISALPTHFSVSLFQRLIKAKYEVRVFVIGCKVFSMAIFKKSKKEKGLDYRSQGGNLRTVPFILSEDIELKVKKLLARFELKTASIDLICGEDDVLYFLEVNPVGQFDKLSEICNYYLEKEVAINLIENG